jgi:bacteriorhodopsin
MEPRRNARYYIFAMFVVLLVCFMFCLFGVFDPGASSRSAYFTIAFLQLLAALLFLGLYLKYR